MAPSPTGSFHVGSARTALFNWLFARGLGGTFILRIEDTDAERGREEWVDGITSALGWLGLDWDEGPFHQSERAELYLRAAASLAESGSAYWCDCARQDVADRTAAAAGSGAASGSVASSGSGAAGYDGYCRERGLGPAPGRALRFKVPRVGATLVHDIVRGDVSFENRSIEDFVLLKGSGAPLFLLANAVDDVDMGITHVIRGEDHLSNTPKYLLIWRALAAGPEPTFGHLPMLVNERGQKLSKRRDPVALESYQHRGFVPDAMVNYLALLGWGPAGDTEILSRDELVGQFRLENVKSSPAFFDLAKLTHFNGVYIRSMSVPEFVEAAGPWLAMGPWPPQRYDPGVFARLAPLIRDRVATLSEVPAMVDFVFLESPVMDPASWNKVMVAQASVAADILERAQSGFATCAWEVERLHSVTLAVAQEVGLKLGKAQAPIRVAVTGRQVGPPLFESLEVLGRDVTLERLAAALHSLA